MSNHLALLTFLDFEESQHISMKERNFKKKNYNKVRRFTLINK